MLQRTWEYGTKKRVEVLRVLGNAPSARSFFVATDGEEGFILAGIDVSKVKKGQTVTIVFKKGGPTGGYWDVGEVNAKSD